MIVQILGIKQMAVRYWLLTEVIQNNLSTIQILFLFIASFCFLTKFNRKDKNFCLVTRTVKKYHPTSQSSSGNNESKTLENFVKIQNPRIFLWWSFFKTALFKIHNLCSKNLTKVGIRVTGITKTIVSTIKSSIRVCVITSSSLGATGDERGSCSGVSGDSGVVEAIEDSGVSLSFSLPFVDLVNSISGSGCADVLVRY